MLLISQVRNQPVVMDNDWINQQLEAFDDELASSPPRRRSHCSPPSHPPAPPPNVPLGPADPSSSSCMPPFHDRPSTSREKTHHQLTVGTHAARLSNGKRKAIDNIGEEPPHKKRRVAVSLSKKKQKQQPAGRRTLPPRECAADSNRRHTRYRKV